MDNNSPATVLRTLAPCRGPGGSAPKYGMWMLPSVTKKIPRHEQPIKRLLSRSSRYTYVEGRQAVSQSQMIFGRKKNCLLNPMNPYLRNSRMSLCTDQSLNSSIGIWNRWEPYRQQKGSEADRLWQLTLAPKAGSSRYI